MKPSASSLPALFAALIMAAMSPGLRAEAPAVIVDEVVVPVPREVFSALDQLGAVNWAGMVRKPEYEPSPERHATALIFGVVIAEGFIAVQAKDADATKRLGPIVLELAELLGVRESVAAHAKAIVDGAEQGDWDAVRLELDRTQGTVRNTMTQLRDARLAQFVSMGGWLRGTEAAAQAILSGFTADKSELLHQPDLVAHFSSVLAGLDGRAANDPAVAKLRENLPALKDLMARDLLDEAAVGEIHKLCATLVSTILRAQDDAEKGGGIE